MKNERLLKATEVAFLIGIAPKTLEVWYMFKRKHPENEYAKMLPDYQQERQRGIRFWKESDIEKIVEFKNSKPKGKNGLFGDITHMNEYRIKREAKNGKKKTAKHNTRRTNKRVGNK